MGIQSLGISTPVTVAIPTCGREQVLVDTIRHLLAQVPPPAEVIVLDQTKKHGAEVERILGEWNAVGAIRWVRLSKACIPLAMNQGLLDASHEIVLFIDDDVVPDSGFVAAHARAHTETGAVLVAGRVIQPWQEHVDFSGDRQFHFASTRSAWIGEFMAGNFSVARRAAINVGGFDERFVRVAYNFEAEFACRLLRASHRIRYEPSACIHHLRVTSGGTRIYGEHLRSFLPNHAVGAYYYFLRTWSGWRSLARFFGRPFHAISTRHHLHRPWWIPATLVAELWGMAWAITLAARGPRLLKSPEVKNADA